MLRKQIVLLILILITIFGGPTSAYANGRGLGLRKISVFLMLDRLYAEIMERQNAPIDSKGFRQMRLIVAVDEAHNYLPCKQPTLEKFVRESASKGVGIMLLQNSSRPTDIRTWAQ